MDRQIELFNRFVEALGGESNVTQYERPGLILAAGLIAISEERDRIACDAAMEAAHVKGLARIALDACNLPGSAGRMLDRPD